VAAGLLAVFIFYVAAYYAIITPKGAWEGAGHDEFVCIPRYRVVPEELARSVFAPAIEIEKPLRPEKWSLEAAVRIYHNQ